MKKFLSLLIVILLVSLSILSVSAEQFKNGDIVVADTESTAMYVDITGGEGGILAATLKITGPSTLTTLNGVYSFPTNKVDVVDVDTKTEVLTSNKSGAVNIAPYFKLNANTLSNGWNVAPNAVNVTGSAGIAIGFAKNTGSDLVISEGTTEAIYTVYFKLKDKAEIEASDFEIKKVGLNAPKLVYGSTALDLSTTNYSSLAKVSTYAPYLPPATDPEVDEGGKDEIKENEEDTTPKAVTVTGVAKNFADAKVDVEVGAVLYQGDNFAGRSWAKYFPAYELDGGTSWTKDGENQGVEKALWGKTNGRFAVTLDNIAASKLDAGDYTISAYQLIDGEYTEVSGTSVTFTKEAKEEVGD